MTRQEIINKINEKIELYKSGKSGLNTTELTEFLIDAFEAMYQAGREEAIKNHEKG